MDRRTILNRRIRPVVAAMVVMAAATPVAQAAPLGAATFGVGHAVTAAPQVETVSWRGRRNTALVAGALGLTALGLAAAAASQPRYSYGYGYGYQPYGYGYQPYAYDDGYRYSYAPSPRYRPIDDYDYGYVPVRPRYRYAEREVFYGPPPRAHRHGRQPFYFDYGRGFQRGKDPAGN